MSPETFTKRGIYVGLRTKFQKVPNEKSGSQAKVSSKSVSVAAPGHISLLFLIWKFENVFHGQLKLFS